MEGREGHLGRARPLVREGTPCQSTRGRRETQTQWPPEIAERGKALRVKRTGREREGEVGVKHEGGGTQGQEGQEGSRDARVEVGGIRRGEEMKGYKLEVPIHLPDPIDGTPQA